MAFANHGVHKSKQVTFKVPLENGDIDIIKVKATNKTSFANHVGYSVTVNDKKYFTNVLTFAEAIESCYIRYIKAER